MIMHEPVILGIHIVHMYRYKPWSQIMFTLNVEYFGLHKVWWLHRNIRKGFNTLISRVNFLSSHSPDGSTKLSPHHPIQIMTCSLRHSTHSYHNMITWACPVFVEISIAFCQDWVKLHLSIAVTQIQSKIQLQDVKN